MSLEVICEFDHEPVRMSLKGKGSLNYSWMLACPTCNIKVDILGNGLYCGRCGDRMKRIEQITICPTCRYEVKVPKHIRPTMMSLINTKAPSIKPTGPATPSAPPPATTAIKAPSPPATPLTPTLPPGVDPNALNGILKLLDMKGSIDLPQAVAIIKLRTKQEKPDPQPYIKALEAQGKAKLEGDKLVKSP